MHVYAHVCTYVYAITNVLVYPLVIEVFYEIFKVSGQSPNTVGVNYPIELASMDNYVEPCDYKGYGGQVCPPVHVCTRMYTDVQATCGLLLYNMGTDAVTRVSGYVV